VGCSISRTIHALNIVPSLCRSKTFLVLVVIGIVITAIAWGPCLAPWQVECFKIGDWGDYKFHYQGWISYLRGPTWMPPYLYSFSWPEKSSVMFTDSIPLAAIVFKPITLLLHLPDWQYFSLLSVLNALVIAYCSCCIGQRMGWKVLTTLGCGIVLMTSSLSWTRLAVHHEALQLHGLLILAMTWVITRQSSMRAWLCLIVAAIGIHAYYLPLILAAMLPYWLTATQKVRKAFVIILVIAASSFAFGFLPGSLSSNSEVWGANLLTLIDPQNHSVIFPQLPKKEPYEVEGYSYLGLGVVFALVLVLAKDEDWKLQETLFPAAWWFASLALFVFALGHTWNIADVPITPHKAILAIPGVSKIYDIFRSSGRFVWPIAYSTTIWALHRLNKSNLHRIIIPIVVLLQLFDSNLKSIYRRGTSYSNILTSRDNFVDWSEQNSDLADQIKDANGFIVGHVADTSRLPPPYTPQYLNPSIVSNWGGVGITRVPRTSSNLSSFDQWLNLMKTNSRASLFCNSTSSQECSFIIITDSPPQIRRLYQLSQDVGLSTRKLSESIYKVSSSR